MWHKIWKIIHLIIFTLLGIAVWLLLRSNKKGIQELDEIQKKQEKERLTALKEMNDSDVISLLKNKDKIDKIAESKIDFADIFNKWKKDINKNGKI